MPLQLWIPGVGNVEWANPCGYDDEICKWNWYKSQPHTYKVYGTTLKEDSKKTSVFALSPTSEERALKIFFTQPSCKAGCKVTHIGTNKINKSKEIELASKYLPPLLFYELYKKTAKKTTTKKESKDTDQTSDESASGTAFFNSNKGHMITNFHVIETCNNNSKVFYNNNKIDAKLIAKDKYLDLALLKAEVNNTKFITISNMAPKKLQRIIAAGFPFGKYLSDDMKFTSGIVSSLKGFQDDSTRLQIDAALNPGNSGGPIVDENTGKLVAVAVAGLRKDMTEAVNFGIKAGSVRNFLHSNQINILNFEKNYRRGEVAELLENSVL